MSWPIFVGGARHATVYEPPQPQESGAAVLAVSPDGTMLTGHQAPPSFVDTATGDQYSLVQVTFQVPHPLTGQPDQTWENTVYLHVDLGADPNVGMTALQDAVTRWWFRTSGTHKALSTPDKNGHSAPAKTVYRAHCTDCAPERRTFDNAGSRALWMTGHIEATGHKVTWTDEQEGADDGGQRIGNIQEG
jgi:hypothetical protein